MQYRRTIAVSIFQNSISRNTKCDNLVSFSKSSDIWQPLHNHYARLCNLWRTLYEVVTRLCTMPQQQYNLVTSLLHPYTVVATMLQLCYSWVTAQKFLYEYIQLCSIISNLQKLATPDMPILVLWHNTLSVSYIQWLTKFLKRIPSVTFLEVASYLSSTITYWIN